MSQQPNSCSSPNAVVAVKTIGRKDPNVAYTDRSAVRAILQNPLNRQIALIHVILIEAPWRRHRTRRRPFYRRFEIDLEETAAKSR